MTNCPDGSATARSWGSPLRNSSTIAPGAALPAMTASPVRSMRAMSKAGMDSSASGERGDTASGAATAFALACAVVNAAEPSSRSPDAGGKIAGAAVAALGSTGGSRLTCVMPKTSAAPHAATSARDGTTIRAIDVTVMIRDRWPDRWLVSTPGRPCADLFRSSSPPHRVSHRSVVLTSAHRGVQRGHFGPEASDSAC